MLDAQTREILRDATDRARRRGIQASLLLHRERSHLLRLGNSSVSLNTTETLTRLKARVVDGCREATHTSLRELTSAQDALDTLEITVAKVREAPAREFEPILERVEEGVAQTGQYDPALAELDGTSKTEGYARIMRDIGPTPTYSGAWSSGATETYLISTATDDEAYHRCTDSQFSLVLKHPTQEWELRTDQSGWRVVDFSAERAVADIMRVLPVYQQREGIKVEPGTYTVLFGPQAMAEILGMALWTGFHGRMYEEKQGWTSHNAMGDTVFGANITVTDDPGDPDTFRYAFDLGGTKRRRYPLVERGCIAGLMYDIETAAKYKRPLTGHTTQTTSVVMDGGHGPDDALAAVVDRERVLWIPALHYMHVPSMAKGLFTGSSRFSAVVVERGKIVAPLFSSRVTESFQNLFNNLAVLAAERVSVNLSDTYGRRAPVAWSIPRYAVAEGVHITDSADSF
ncbi:MAG: metallopeptidase TldD-related protein [Candidatus Eisenbacteria bacterium]|jgi:predicted Zn-dependent protease|nr:metallopeptidase TldD-related protein [Candidatus Eisenbacteria bacterium]